LRHCKTDKDETYRQTEKKTEENRLKYRDLKAETLREKGDTLRERDPIRLLRAIVSSSMKRKIHRDNIFLNLNQGLHVE